MSNIYTLTAYFKHRLKSKNRHGIHSPFVYKLLDEVIYHKGKYYNFDKIDLLRKKMLKDPRTLTIQDFGAGSKKLGTTRKVSDIAKTSVKKRELAELLYRLTVNFQPRNTLELGTSLGLTTLYFALANQKGKVYTIEGDPSIRNIAIENLKALQVPNVNSIEGKFDEILPELLQELETVDLVFVDGNHRKEPTLKYFHTLLPYMNNGGFFIFDDIYWSKEMTEAWQEVVKSPKITVTIDLFYFGLAFIRPEQTKEHFSIRL